jgi:hypothetical protein
MQILFDKVGYSGCRSTTPAKEREHWRDFRGLILLALEVTRPGFHDAEK